METNPAGAVGAYKAIMFSPDRSDEAALKIKEEALYRLAKLYVTRRQFDEVMGLLQSADPFFAVIPKVNLIPMTDSVFFFIRGPVPLLASLLITF